MPLPPLLSSRPPAHQIASVVVIPCLFGALCGWMLGVSEAVYLILAVPVGILGGFFAGLEHSTGSEGALRGTFGGLEFGAFIVVVRALTELDDKANIPHPAILLVVITTVGGAILGYLGGRVRERRTPAAQ